MTSRAHVEELRSARDDEFSFMEATNEVRNTLLAGVLSLRAYHGQDFNFEFTMGSEVHHNPYHVTVIRSQLPRKIGILYAEMRDEIIAAFDEILDLNDNGEMLFVTRKSCFVHIERLRMEEHTSLDHYPEHRVQG